MEDPERDPLGFIGESHLWPRGDLVRNLDMAALAIGSGHAARYES